MMEGKILQTVISQGVWAVLFVYLLFYVLKENGAREARYQEIINKLTEKFENIEKGITDIQENLKDMKGGDK